MACKTDKIDSLVLAVLSQRDLVPAIWLPDPHIREERELARFRLHLVKHKTALKDRVHSTLINFGRACPVTDLFGAKGRRLLERLEIPEPWRSNVTAAVVLIDDLERQIAELNRRLREGHADHPYVPLLMSAPGIGWVLAFTIAAEIGEIERFASPEKLASYTGLCPRVNQSGESDRRGPLTKHGPRYLRWALIEATMHALKHPAYAERYERNNAGSASSAEPNDPRSAEYLLHFERPYKHARQYPGFAEDLERRRELHRAGRGARLVEVVVAAGIGFQQRAPGTATGRSSGYSKTVTTRRRGCAPCAGPRDAAMADPTPNAAPRASAPRARLRD